ncbi:tetratricopeptide repeat protein [Dictyobacter formicarum]|uniref:Chemotaxis methyl-accepting receptor HlyB-like 4HB MCP domain-containing protein n=1 Tax=Dictyobacter formicarum TaxID=2778368 RepID=A0ABQ3VQB3_9CHLR|nr:tetratricopeptide repeat protein [Dictyobacter formicarum]GHO87566.1 hypothetical protein KSZ_55720 [Dictyobacter formicarum]
MAKQIGKQVVSSSPAQTIAARSQSSPQLDGMWRKLGRQAYQTLKGQFVLLAAGCMLVALILSLLIAQQFRRANDDLNTIVSGSIPSVNAAQAIAQYIGDIDAKSADYLATASLKETGPCSVVGTGNTTIDGGTLTVHDCDAKDINAELILMNQQIYLAAHNVTYSGEQTAIERIIAGAEEYSSNVAIMQHEFSLAKSMTDPQDEHLVRAYAAYQAAGDVLHSRIQRVPQHNANGTYALDESSLPNCRIGSRSLSPNEWVFAGIETNVDCLNAINKQHLDDAYSNVSGSLTGDVVLAILLCLAFCALLAFTTWRMARITHRIINMGLSLALVIGIVFSLTVVSNFLNFAGRHGAYGQIVQDDYDSIYYAAQLNRYATNANADESRWLVALTFHDQAGVARWQADWQTSTQQVQTLIDRAQANRTWPEEDQPLQDMHNWWAKYYGIDGSIRSTAQVTDGIASSTHLLQAEKLSTGDSNTAFGNFTTAVDHLRQANDGHYSATLQATQITLNVYSLFSLVLFISLGILAVWGVMYRLKDF